MQGDDVKALFPEEKAEAAGLKNFLMNELESNFDGGLKKEQAICDQVRDKLTAYLNEEYPDPHKILDILCDYEERLEDEG